jgi:hypothetical protein
MNPVSTIFVAVWLTMHLSAQVPNTLLHSIPAPLGAQTGAGLGYSVAADGNYTVVGAPYDELRVQGSGVAKVFDSTTGALLFLLPNPTPAVGEVFGRSVAIDGTSVATSVQDNTVMFGKGTAYVFGPIDGDSDGLRDTWEITHFGTQYGHGSLDDDDHDGIVNLLELAFNLNPTLANGAALPPAVNEGGYLTLTLTKQPGVTYEVQSAGTLLPALPESFSPASTTLLIDNATTLKVRDTVLMNTPGGRFMRAAVTASP